MSWCAAAWRLFGLERRLWPAGVDSERRMPLTGHLAELRRRLIVGLFALACGTALTWGSLGHVYAWLARPAGAVQLVALGPGEGFATDLRLALFGGCCLALPTWLVQAALFIAPALDATGRRRLPLWMAGALALACGGGLAGYFVVLPAALRFLLTRGAAAATVMSVARYTGFALAALLTTAAIAEFPLVLLVLSSLGVVSPEALRQRRRQGWLLMVVGAALITPSTDAVTLVLLTGPLIALYEITLLLMKAVRA